MKPRQSRPRLIQAMVDAFRLPDLQEDFNHFRIADRIPFYRAYSITRGEPDCSGGLI